MASLFSLGIMYSYFDRCVTGTLPGKGSHDPVDVAFPTLQLPGCHAAPRPRVAGAFRPQVFRVYLVQDPELNVSCQPWECITCHTTPHNYSINCPPLFNMFQAILYLSMSISALIVTIHT